MRYLTFALIFLLSFTLSLSAQEKPKASDKPITTKPEISLTLTPGESEELNKIQAEVNTLGGALNESLKEMKAAVTDKDLLPAAWKASAIFSKLLDSQTKFQAWMTETQKVHNCVGCGLDIKSATFIKPAEEKK